MQLQTKDYMDDAKNGRPRSYVAAQIVRDGIPPAEQEVGWPDEEREPEEPEGEVASGDGGLLDEAGPGFAPVPARPIAPIPVPPDWGNVPLRMSARGRRGRRSGES